MEVQLYEGGVVRKIALLAAMTVQRVLCVTPQPGWARISRAILWSDELRSRQGGPRLYSIPRRAHAGAVASGGPSETWPYLRRSLSADSSWYEAMIREPGAFYGRAGVRLFLGRDVVC